jgi:hypothetical protein
MRKKITIFTITAILCIFTATINAANVIPAVILLESKEVTPGSTFTIKVSLSGNSENITSLRIPLSFDQDYLSCAYVDFGGALLTGEMEASYTITPDGVEIAYIPPVVNPLPSFADDSGLIATIYMTVGGDTPAGILVVNAVNRDEPFEQFGTTFHRWTRPEIADSDGLITLLPAFIPAALTVLDPTDVTDEADGLLPDEFILHQNHPNPFNPSTKISFTIPQKTNIRLEVFNILGREVATLAEGEFPAGSHEIEWQADNFPSGIYFYKMTAGKASFTRKMLLIK